MGLALSDDNNRGMDANFVYRTVFVARKRRTWCAAWPCLMTTVGAWMIVLHRCSEDKENMVCGMGLGCLASPDDNSRGIDANFAYLRICAAWALATWPYLMITVGD
jgi:hypothetical protein